MPIQSLGTRRLLSIAVLCVAGIATVATSRPRWYLQARPDPARAGVVLIENSLPVKRQLTVTAGRPTDPRHGVEWELVVVLKARFEPVDGGGAAGDRRLIAAVRSAQSRAPIVGKLVESSATEETYRFGGRGWLCPAAEWCDPARDTCGAGAFCDHSFELEMALEPSIQRAEVEILANASMSEYGDLSDRDPPEGASIQIAIE